MDSTTETVIEQEISLCRAIRDRIDRPPLPTPANLLTVTKKACSDALPDLVRKVLHDVARDLEDELAQTVDRGRRVGPLLQMDDAELAAEQRKIAVVRATAVISI